MSEITYLSIFSGIEAASVAFEPLGWKPLAFCEIDPFPSATLARNYPDVVNLGDIRQVDWSDFVQRFGRPDVLCGGSPCTSFSIAGGRESLDGESRLMFEYIRAVEALRCRYIIFENVPGVLSTRDNAFGQFLAKMVEIGYRDISYRVLDAQFFGLAQRRKRVFVVGHLAESGFRSAAVLDLAGSSARDTQKESEKREALAAEASGGTGTAGEDGCLTPWDVQSRRVYVDESESWPTLYAGEGGGHGYVASDDSPIAFKWFQGARSHTMPAYDDGTTPTLTNSDSHVPAVAYETPTLEPVVMASGQAHAEISRGGVAPTIAARNYKDPPLLFEQPNQ